MMKLLLNEQRIIPGWYYVSLMLPGHQTHLKIKVSPGTTLVLTGGQSQVSYLLFFTEGGVTDNIVLIDEIPEFVERSSDNVLRINLDGLVKAKGIATWTNE